MPFKPLPLILLMTLPVLHGLAQADDKNGRPVLHRKVPIPSNFIITSDGLTYGGDIRLGDLQNNGEAAFVVYRTAQSVDGGASQPCFLGAFTQTGQPLWQKGTGGLQPNRPGPVAIYDIDADGETEVITLFAENPENTDPFTMQNMTVQVLDGATGKIERQASPAALTSSAGEGPNWVHQRILIANLRRNTTPQDFIIKLGKKIIAFDDRLHVLWTYQNAWDEYANCPAYVPAVGDMNNDSKDEITVPHGQELRVAHFTDSFPGQQMVIRYNGHHPEAMLVHNTGEVVRRFVLNESPNNTGMEAVYWHGRDKAALLYNGGMLWKGDGTASTTLPGLPAPRGNMRQGWYHCIPANVCGDDREEAIVYNPWDQYIYIYTPAPFNPKAFSGYNASPRQYNVRLMD